MTAWKELKDMPDEMMDGRDVLLRQVWSDLGPKFTCTFLVRMRNGKWVNTWDHDELFVKEEEEFLWTEVPE